MRGALARAALAAACYSPKIAECTVRCGAANSCPSGMSCLADNFCHSDLASSCAPGRDGGFGVVDAQPGADGPMFAVDARIPDAPPVADAPAPPDAPSADAGGCHGFITTLDSDGHMLVSNLSVDRTDTVHNTYIDDDSLELLYLRRPAGAGFGAREQVTGAGPFLKGQTVDATGAVHVAFTEGSIGNLRLRYAHRSPGAGGQWSDETITENDSPTDATIVVDRSGTVQVAYFAQDVGQLLRSRRTNGKWITDTIDNGGLDDVGEFPSMAVAPTGTLAVTYRDVTAATLKVATQVGTGWATRTLDSTSTDVGAYTALAIDASGVLHVAYADLANGTLKYLEASGDSITRTVADDTDAVGKFNSIALDGNGGVHISTDAYLSGDLHHVHRARGAAHFTVDNVDSADAVGRHTSIGVDSAGAIHISYIDDTTHALKYAFICPTL